MRYVNRFDTEAPAPRTGHGVWDVIGKQWIAEHLTGEDASWHAAVLSLRYTETGERPDDCAWYRDPPPHVELHITPRRTEVARLHMWARESDGLYGYVTYLERPARDGGRWAPAKSLRQLTPDEIDRFTQQQASRQSFGLPTGRT